MGKVSGMIQLEKEPFDFYWLKHGSAENADNQEVYGWIENEYGSIVHSCSGWYGTTDPYVACSLAEQKLHEQKN